MKNVVKTKQLFKNFVWIALVFFTFLGCRKNDVLNSDKIESYEELKNNFFNTNSTNDIEIKKLAADIKKQDSIFKFLPDFVRKNGIPKWDKVIYKTNNHTNLSGRQSSSISKNSSPSSSNNSSRSNSNNNQGVFFIPLQSQSTQAVQSYITAYKHNDSLYTYRVYNKDSLNAIQAGSNTTKNNLLNTQAVFGYFEKSVNNVDSINVNSPVNATLKNVNISFDGSSSKITTNGINANSMARSSSCDISIMVQISYEITGWYVGDTLVAAQVNVSIVMVITIDCSGGGGGGGCGCGGGSYGGGSTGGGSTGGGSTGGGSTGGGNNWWGYGSGWPWNYGGGGSYDPNWYWWWTGGGGFGGGGNNTGFSSTVTSLSLQLGLTYAQSLWLENNPEFVTLINEQLTENDFSEESKTTSKILIDLGINNLLETTWGADFGNTAIPHLSNLYSCCPGLLMIPNFGLKWSTQTLASYVLIRQENPGWSKLRCAWEALQESVHTGLDMAGLIPVIGEVFDITNGIIYTIQGDGLNATLSFAGAVPFVGMAATTAKYFTKTITAIGGASIKLRFIKLTNDAIGFSKNSKLFRKSLGLLPGDPRQAHHIIPWGNEIPMHDAIQKAAKSSHAFHMDDALNGIPVEAWRNQPNHPAFNSLIKAKLDAISTNLSNEATYNAVLNIINQAKQAILNNPNVHINNITF